MQLAFLKQILFLPIASFHFPPRYDEHRQMPFGYVFNLAIIWKKGRNEVLANGLDLALQI